MSNNRDVKRRVYFIRDSSQPELIVGIQMIYLMLAIFSGVILYIVMQHNLAPSETVQPVKGQDALELLLPTIITLNVVGLVVTSIVSVFFTHRITGPVYRLRFIMRDVADGNLTRLAAFRKGDELQELADSFDEMVIGLNRRLYRLRQQGDAVLEAMGRPATDGQAPPVTFAANQLVAELARFRLMPRDELDARE